jgi:hypothetical protein
MIEAGVHALSDAFITVTPQNVILATLVIRVCAAVDAMRPQITSFRGSFS